MIMKLLIFIFLSYTIVDSHLLEPLADDLACSATTLTAMAIKKRYNKKMKAAGIPTVTNFKK